MDAADWRIIIITPSRKLTSELHTLFSTVLPKAKILEFSGYPTDAQVEDIRLNGPGTVCFLDLISESATGLTSLAKILAASPKLPVISLVDSAQPQLILQALRGGAQDFFTYPFSADQLQSIADKLSVLIPALSNDSGKITCVVPSKGACGASTIAFNLAMILKKSAGRGKTLLADLDPMTGTQSFQMKLRPAFSFLDALQHSAKLDADLWRGMIQTYQGLDVLLPPENPVEAIQEVSDARPILEFARRMYEHVIVDIGHAYGDWTISALQSADEILLVTTNELPALQAAQRVLGYYDTKGVSAHKIHLILNRFNKDIGLSKDMVETALHADVQHVLISDYEGVQQALLDGKAILPTTAVGKQLVQLANRVAGRSKESVKAEKVKPTSTLSGLFGLFSRSS